MKTLKRLMCILLTVILLIPFAGCSRPGENNNPADNSGMNNNNINPPVEPFIMSLCYWAATENPYNIKDKETIQIRILGGSILKPIKNAAYFVIFLNRKYIKAENFYEAMQEEEIFLIEKMPYTEFFNKFYCEGESAREVYNEIYEIPVSAFKSESLGDDIDTDVYLSSFIIDDQGTILAYIGGRPIYYEKSGDYLTLYIYKQHN